MESYLNDNFEVKPKNSSEEALERWRKLCWLVTNKKRRLRFTANMSKRFEARAIQRSNLKSLRALMLVSHAAVQFLNGITYSVPEEVKAAGFQIGPDELGSIVEGRNSEKLKAHDGEDLRLKIPGSGNWGNKHIDYQNFGQHSGQAREFNQRRNHHFQAR